MVERLKCFLQNIFFMILAGAMEIAMVMLLQFERLRRQRCQ